jgi:hypothetical protein
MATEIIPAGNGPQNSAPFTLTEGQELTLSLFPAAGNFLSSDIKPLVVAKQASNGAWTRTRVILSFEQQIVVLRGAGDYRLERDQQPAGVSVGADKG